MLKKILFLSLLGILIVSCGGDSTKDGGNDDGNEDSFDREGVLNNLASNIIIPAFTDFSSDLAKLKEQTELFTETPNQVNLDGLRSSWYDAYLTWQHVAMFEIGKAEELLFVSYFNIYPLNTSDVETNVSSKSYDLQHPNNHDAQGFPALDYLLYGIGSDDNAILEKYTNTEDYKVYLLDVVTQMVDVNDQILTDWNNGYKANFVSSSGNTVTSSLNKLVNDYIFYFEKRLRAYKIGVPSGVFSNNTLLPDNVEAYYNNDISKKLALEALGAFENFFEGKAYNGSQTGESFKSYLIYLNRNDLVSKIEEQIAKAKAQINLLSNSFSEQINTDNTQMLKAYNELQEIVVLMKVDMLQAFNISVDYVDADGD